MNESRIKVLVVDDSPLMRRIIHDVLVQDPEINVIGSARDGAEALKKAAELNPDVITLDIEMPVMDGISCLEKLQRQGSYGIIVLSGVTKAGTSATIRALELGAFDFIEKTAISLDMTSGNKKNEIIDKIKLAYRTLKKAENLNKCSKNAALKMLPQTIQNDLKYIVALGISTGGPRALSSIIPELPENLPAAVVIVQHMPPGFTRSLAERLNESSVITVKEAEDDDILEAGHVYIAPGDFHLTFADEGNITRIKLTQTPPVGSFRPSVDVMMTSLANSDANSVIGVIMTGMGSDGSKGLVELKKKKNAYIVAQDEATSIVFGMPRSAIELGIVDEIVPLGEIPLSLKNFMGVHE